MVEITPLAQATCNNSPVFEDFPPPVICVNEPLVYSHKATDAEGDELVYEFCSPLLGGSQNNPTPDPDAPPPYQNVGFILPNYSASNPLGGNPRITINPVTGEISGMPTLQGQYVVGICVSEYRNGQLFMTVAAAGRVVNGPKGSGGDITMPIRVATSEGESVPYSNLGQFTVNVVPGAGASQFIYKDDQIVLPEPQSRGFVVYVGFDEGPYNTQ